MFDLRASPPAESSLTAKRGCRGSHTERWYLTGILQVERNSVCHGKTLHLPAFPSPDLFPLQCSDMTDKMIFASGASSGAIYSNGWPLRGKPYESFWFWFESFCCIKYLPCTRMRTVFSDLIFSLSLWVCVAVRCKQMREGDRNFTNVLLPQNCLKMILKSCVFECSCQIPGNGRLIRSVNRAGHCPGKVFSSWIKNQTWPHWEILN